MEQSPMFPNLKLVLYRERLLVPGKSFHCEAYPCTQAPQSCDGCQLGEITTTDAAECLLFGRVERSLPFDLKVGEAWAILRGMEEAMEYRQWERRMQAGSS